ncbi:ribonuclease III [SAR86 cluster bacterium]|nr:ribonuclease III [SAR86 cluster bacterium]
MTENFINLEKKINYSFKNKIYLSTALTHSSKSKTNNERLEYLGDAVINLAISDYLIKNFTDLDEGSLSILRSNLVSRVTLSKVASQLGLESYLKIGKSLLNQENKKISIYGNAFEAIIGGIYLDKDFSQAASVVINLLKKEIESLKKNKTKDKKTLLQEELQQRKVDLPVYKLNYENDESFNVICEVQELDLLSEGQGKNKKEAEQNAAANLLKKLINDNG